MKKIFISILATAVLFSCNNSSDEKAAEATDTMTHDMPAMVEMPPMPEVPANAKDFWKPLMYAFPLLDTANKRRDKIAYKLNLIRKFRNRIFHYEPICNDLTALAANHNNILEILNWINADIVSWTKQIDRFDNLYKQAIALRSAT